MTTTAQGPSRPLRALAAVFGLWVVGRAAFVWSETEPVSMPTTKVLTGTQMPVPRGALPVRAILVDGIATEPKSSKSRGSPNKSIMISPVLIEGSRPSRSDPGAGGQSASAFLARTETGSHSRSTAPLNRDAVAQPVSLRPAHGSVLPNWTGSLWMAARDGSDAGLAAGNGQLGGSQAGLRVYRRLTPALALTGRVSAALASPQTEASAGVALRHGNFAVLAERRFALDRGGRNDWSLTAVAGVSDVSLPLKFRLDGYVQAGVVGQDGFADGSVRVERQVAAKGKSRLSAGAGAWGSIQPGVARLDVGPQIVGRTVIGGYPVRVSAEWRQRVAGRATPISGPVVTLGADF